METKEPKGTITRFKADLILLIVAILWGSTFVGNKYTLQYFKPLYIMAIRFSIAFIIMALVFRKKVAAIKKSDLKGGIIVGILLYSAFFTQVTGLQYTTAGKQAFLSGTYVVMAPFLFWIVNRKKPDLRSFIGAVICFLGVSLLSLNSQFRISFGDSITLFSSLLFAGHIIATGYFVEKMDMIILTIIQFGVAGILSLATAPIFEPMPHGVSLNGILAIAYLAVFCTCAAYFLQTVGQKYTLSTHASIILSTESVFGCLLSVILLGEAFTLKMFLGCIAILASILVVELK